MGTSIMFSVCGCTSPTNAADSLDAANLQILPSVSQHGNLKPMGGAAVITKSDNPSYDEDDDGRNNGDKIALRAAVKAIGGHARGRESRGERNSPSTTGNKQAKNTISKRYYDPHKDIGVRELIGMGIPCGRQHVSTDRRGNKPFASNPLIDRGDSLAQQTSLLSLIASDTMDTATVMTSPGNNDNCKQILRGNDYQSACPEAEEASTKSNSSTSNSSRKSPVDRTRMRHNQSSRRGGQQQQQQTTPPSTPGDVVPPSLELSMAKQVANMAQMTNDRRIHSRETLRNHRNLHGSHPSSPGRCRGEKTGSGSPSLLIRDKSLVTQKEDEFESSNDGDKTASRSNRDAAKATVSSFAYFEKAKPPSLWKEGDNSELVSTYQFPRLYLRDPAKFINQELNKNNSNNKNNNLDKKQSWWFHLAQKMETTLPHVQHEYWKALLLEHNNNHNMMSGSDLISAASSSVPQNSFCSDGGQDSCVAMRNLCLGQEQQLGSSRGSSSKQNVKRGASVAVASSSFQPTSPPINCWSEPSASTMKVRGANYAKNGVKVESETSMFSVLGADSFVSGKGRSEECSFTKGFLHQWTRACKEVGLTPPFLLIINFIVPWGNFQVYLIRPDADEGPFSSQHKNRPSERAWTKFMEGSADYRNQRLKLIPRVVAGPWMVKKMVGSTPVVIGTKLPVSYNGSLEENYLEISLDVTKGPAFGNSVANTVVGKADTVSVDLGFIIEGTDREGHLPEQMLGLVRLHHLNMKKAPTHCQWKENLSGQ